MRTLQWVFILVLVVSGCVGGAPPTPGDGRVEVRVAPLHLPGVDKICFDLAVTNAIDRGGDLVWQAGTPGLNGGAGDPGALCSDRYGNAEGGDIAYVGPCDASGQVDSNDPAGERWNSVTLWIDGVYDERGVYVEPAGQDGWQDPCARPGGGAGGCTLNVLCAENADASVRFDLTIMRRAKQGFFDIVVNFEDIFCSAKVDTCHADGSPIRLLFGDDGERDRTAVLGLACTAGAGPIDTTLMLGAVAIDCGGSTLAFDPSGNGGNHSLSVANRTVRYALYRGAEAIRCGGDPCNKLYWNLAFDLEDLEALGACTLRVSATATDGDDGFAAGVLTGAGVVYPFVDALAPLTGPGVPACQHHGLDGGGPVATAYHGTLPSVTPAPPMCWSFDGSAADAIPGRDPTCDLAAPPAEPSCDRSVNGAGEHVIDLYVDLPAGATLLSISDATIASTDGAATVHDDLAGGSFAPQFVGAGADDSFVTIGGALGPTSSTNPDPAWFPSGFASASVPAGAGWFNANPANLQGLAVSSGPASRVLIGRFVRGGAPGAARLSAGFTVHFNTGLGTPPSALRASYDIAWSPTGACVRNVAAHVPEADQVIDGDDLAELLAAWRQPDDRCVVDLDRSGTVDAVDLTILLGAWGPMAEGWCAPDEPDPIDVLATAYGDTNGDGFVDFFDRLAAIEGGDAAMAGLVLVFTRDGTHSTYTAGADGKVLVSLPASGCYVISVGSGATLVSATDGDGTGAQPYCTDTHAGGLFLEIDRPWAGTCDDGVCDPLDEFECPQDCAPWHNPALPEDVNGDGVVSPVDSLLLIDLLNEFGDYELPPTRPDGQPYYDVNADGYVTPTDALLVINYLNAQGGG